MDYTTVHPLSASQAHHIDLHLWRGAPQNLDPDRPVQILVNQGYVVGFSPTTLQPAWSAYRVAHADAHVDYARPMHYYADLRLDEAHRLSKATFGKLGGIPLNVGHMTPNEVINRQFGRLAQLETFLMSNMSPQYGALNSGVWLKLEDAIRAIEDEPGKDHVWATVGPVFGEEPAFVTRDGGKLVPVPETYFAIIVDPHTYPYDTPSKVRIDCFLIPQTAPRGSTPDAYPATLEEIERRTRLRFFASWGRTYALGQQAREDAQPQSRLMRAIAAKKDEWAAGFGLAAKAQPDAETIAGLIDSLKAEADAINAQVSQQGRAVTEEERVRIETIQHTISWLLRAQEIAGAAEPARPAEGEPAANLVTYKIISDLGDRLKMGARSACNFWNRFVEPVYSIVIRLGVFTEESNTIAYARQPYDNGDGVHYGEVRFNTKFLMDYSDEEIAGTIIHEIGHTLGIGWKVWDTLYDRDTGKFLEPAVEQVAGLSAMEVERGGGPGTIYSHWSETLFDRELMTGYKDKGEFVLPVTIDVMEALGHRVRERLAFAMSLEVLLRDAKSMVFSRQGEARRLDLDYYKETPVVETLPHVPEFD
ncbi:DNA/RNA endonuclease [Novosphingobium sp. PC22D]|uniref:DNA/RNA non-specific endonuclease n=1 Tax=Novosphingobium sp. PC22D TaxID=1962403 RepID=UPI000BEF90AF|nr:DNA/RNA non-specific endonuclease [Novosphingobium sp. PC22D]PEQ14601.1 DNA/RNA endonuclease [Novosphingobium sp. PC22D]